MCSPKKQSIALTGKETFLMEDEKLVLEICECYVQTEEIENEDQESDDEASLVNETGSIEDALEANSSWNEHLFDKDDSIYKVPFPDSFCDLNDEEIRPITSDDKLNTASFSKVEAWLSSNSKNLNKRVQRREHSLKIKENTINEKCDLKPGKGIAEKRKLDFEDHFPSPKKHKSSQKESILGSISGWITDFFR